MPRDLIPQNIVDAIIRAGGTTVYGMDIAAHPTGPGYCVYDNNGNVACFDYDPASDRASIRYSTIPGVGTPPEPAAKPSAPQPEPSAKPSAPHSKPAPAPLSVDDILHPVVADTTWSHIPVSRSGFLPGFLDAVSTLVLLAGFIIAIASGSTVYCISSLVSSFLVSALFAWFGGVLRSLRHIEAQLYCANHPEWVAARDVKKAGN